MCVDMCLNFLIENNGCRGEMDTYLTKDMYQSLRPIIIKDDNFWKKQQHLNDTLTIMHFHVSNLGQVPSPQKEKKKFRRLLHHELQYKQSLSSKHQVKKFLVIVMLSW